MKDGITTTASLTAAESAAAVSAAKVRSAEAAIGNASVVVVARGIPIADVELTSVARTADS